jgi:preprotein translocase subunit SecF
MYLFKNKVVQAFNLGADALRGLMKQVDADKVDETMDKVRDTLEDQKEAEDALAAGSEQVTNTILDSQQDDDEELEKELELLLTNQDNTSTKTQVPRLNGIKASPPLNSAMPQKPESSHEPESETELEEKPTRKKVGEKVAIPL